MLRRTLLLTFSVSLALVGLSSGAQIAIQNNNAPFPIGNVNGIAISGGNFVIVGTFSGMDNAAIQGMAFDPAALDAAFTQFGAATDFATPDANNLPGIFNAEIAAGIGAGDPLIGQNIFIVAGEGSDLASARSLAILRSTTDFERDDPAFGASLAAADMTVVIGVLGDVQIPGGATIAGVRIGIPEPSTSLLLTLPVLLAFRRRR